MIGSITGSKKRKRTIYTIELFNAILWCLKMPKGRQSNNNTDTNKPRKKGKDKNPAQPPMSRAKFINYCKKNQCTLAIGNTKMTIPPVIEKGKVGWYKAKTITIVIDGIELRAALVVLIRFVWARKWMGIEKNIVKKDGGSGDGSDGSDNCNSKKHDSKKQTKA